MSTGDCREKVELVFLSTWTQLEKLNIFAKLEIENIKLENWDLLK